VPIHSNQCKFLIGILELRWGTLLLYAQNLIQLLIAFLSSLRHFFDQTKPNFLHSAQLNQTYQIKPKANIFNFLFIYAFITFNILSKTWMDQGTFYDFYWEGRGKQKQKQFTHLKNSPEAPSLHSFPFFYKGYKIYYVSIFLIFDYGLEFTVDEDDVRRRLETNTYLLYGWSVFPEGSVLCKLYEYIYTTTTCWITFVCSAVTFSRFWLRFSIHLNQSK